MTVMIDQDLYALKGAIGGAESGYQQLEYALSTFYPNAAEESIRAMGSLQESLIRAYRCAVLVEAKMRANTK